GTRHGRRVRATVSGGAVGLILDARDAPLALPRRSEDRRAVLAGWRDTFLREPAQPVAVVGEHLIRSDVGAHLDGGRRSARDADAMQGGAVHGATATG
ncbi:MAG TPA: hypothetical protein VM823_06150, partial [Gaiellales bacterium]|nr:hypothetical protein [Gaiellales bacterium]